jgi:hypothetical protein
MRGEQRDRGRRHEARRRNARRARPDAVPAPRGPQAHRRPPDGSELTPSSKRQPDGTLVKALARPWRWQWMLCEGVYTSVSEIGDAENIPRSYVTRILCWRYWHPTLSRRS